ncbi:Na+/H+ antiporter subunit E [Kaistia geumhonensis]|uniref:Multicomponent K+:H+ antiporter subunit E n=1 Tax=Kaistia geumhonensis TaxID=410839 RepID=A0ABU0M127_9HYPH|nr:Na+/H+ antiporter subunit E [Kaistia geumhonensis]MCX5480120.1 Na+/H+ antiporter subunit E [Kaistia geumhonensis]MDQ0514651.1 multicomponent K+:H+ antiporter subunit E [Kaistia geumhonensis]
MTRWLPYPGLTAALLVMWLLLNGVSTGHLLLGSILAIGAARTMAALQPTKPRVRRWDSVFRLVAIVSVDVVRSNIAVSRIIIEGPDRPGQPGFLVVPLALRDRTALAALACILTATPGTAWLEYRSRRDTLLLHVLDIGEEQDWIDLIKRRYEPLLLEIFE